MIILNLATALALSSDLNLLHCYYSCLCEGREGRKEEGRKSIQSITDGLPIAAGRRGRRSSPAFCNGPADRPTGGGRAGGTRKWARERQQRAVAGRSVRRRRLLLRRRRRTISRRRRECTLILSLFSLLLSPSRQRGETAAATTMMIVTRIKLHFSE